MLITNVVYNNRYADGAKTITNGKPFVDGGLDYKDPFFPKQMRGQINWLNVNEPDVQAIVTSLTSKTMGVNINVQVKSPNATFNREAEALIEDFFGMEMVDGTEIASCDLGEKLHFNDNARVMSDFAALHGGFIIRHHYNNQWRIPYKFERIGVDMIDIGKTDFLYNLSERSETTLNGIVRDKFGAIRYVWLFTDINKSKSVKVPYKDLTYYSEIWTSIDQQTAVSKLTSILARLDATTQYGIAELESAIEEAKAGHYIQSSAYSELMKIVGEEIYKASGTAKTSLDRIQLVKDLVTPILRDLANLGIKARGATPIPQGDTPIFNTSKRNSIYNDMNRNSDMKIASSQGMSDIGVYSKASDANYSSIKYTLETDQRTADIRFDSISNRVFFGILSRLIQVGIQIGRITERTAFWKNPSMFLKFRYLRQNKIDTEPGKTAVANRTNIELGVKTKGQVVEESTGMKYEDFLAKKFEQDTLEIDYQAKLDDYKLKRGIITQEQGVANA